MAIVLFGLFLFEFFSAEGPNWINYGWLVFSALVLWAYLYMIMYKYIKIEHGVLTVISPLRKKINLEDIKAIKKFAGDYILKTDKRKLIVNTRIMDLNSLSDLNRELKKLNLEWE